MTPRPQSDVTTVLQELHAGNPDAQGRLLSLVYDELRRMAAGFVRGERLDHTWQPTDLVHEAVVRLLGAGVGSQNRKQFFAVAARTMRELLVEHARRRDADKRGGGWQRVPLDDVSDYFKRQNLDVLAVHEAIERLATFHERQSQVITLRFFSGFTVEEIAALLAVSVSTVESDLRIAKAWLHTQLAGTCP